MVFIIDFVFNVLFFKENDGVIAAQKNVQDIDTISYTGSMKHIYHIKQYLVTQTI